MKKLQILKVVQRNSDTSTNLHATKECLIECADGCKTCFSTRDREVRPLSEMTKFACL